MSQNNQSMFLNLMSTAVQKESKVEPLLINIFNEIKEGNIKDENQDSSTKQLMKELAIIKTDPLTDLLSGSALPEEAGEKGAIAGIMAPTKISGKQISQLQKKDTISPLISNVFTSIKKGVSGVTKAGLGMAKFLGKAELKLFVSGFKLMGKAVAPFGKAMSLMKGAAFGPFGDILTMFSDLGEILSIGFIPIIVDIQKIILELQPAMLMIAGWITDIYNAIKGFLSGDLSSGAVVDILSGILETALDMFADFLPVIMNVITTFLPMLLDLIVAFAPTILNFITDTIVMLVDLIVENLPMIIDLVIETLLTLVDLIAENLPLIVETLLELIPMLVDILVENLPLIIDVIFELIPMIIEVLVDAIPSLIDAIIEIFILLVDVVTENIPLLVEITIETIIMVVEALIDALPLIIVAIVNAIPLVINALMDALPLILDFIMVDLPALAWSALEIAFDTLMEVIPGMLLDVGKSIIGGIVGGITKSVDNIGDAITETPLFKTIADVWETLTGWFS